MAAEMFDNTIMQLPVWTKEEMTEFQQDSDMLMVKRTNAANKL